MGIGAGSMFVGLGLSSTVAGAAAPRASGGPACTFSANGQSGVGDETQPFLVTGLTASSSINVNCTGLPANAAIATVQASPLAVVTQPFSLSLLGSEADLNSASLGSADGNGVYTTNMNLGTSAAGTFSGGGSLAGTSFVGDPNAQCPPTQAQINAGLVTCVIAVDNIAATTAPGATPSQADFAGLALLDFSGQATPQVPPTVSFNPPLVAAGHSATVTDAGSAASWWAGGWWAGGYPNNGLIAGPYTIPASNVLVNGKQASSSSVQVNPAVYCFYGGTAASCNAGSGQDTPGAGQLFPAQLSGSVAIPSTVTASSAAVTIYEPNNWGTSFPGNNTNSAFPSSDLTATGNVGITDVGYWEVASDGGIFPFGTANYLGSMGGKPLNKPIVGMAATPDGGGYWEVASDGGIFAFGNAQFFGSMGGKPLNWPIVGIAATPDGGGYWEVAADGGIFAFGDAQFYGSMSGKPLDRPVMGIAATSDGRGYWEVATDGGVFAFGDAEFYGSMGGKPLNKPVVGIAGTSDGGGYWEVASDGGIFTFGDTDYLGSMGGTKLNKPVVGMWATGKGDGYWEAASDGGIFNFGGGAPFLGSMAGTKLNEPVIGGALVPVPPTSSLTLAKTTTSSGYGAAGQTIPYSYLVTNGGGTTLTNVAVTDDKNSVSCPSGTLAKGTSETCTGSYTVTQADVDSGSLTSSATASGTNPSGNSVSSSQSVVTLLANSAASSMTMTTSSTTASFAAAGDPIDYQYTVTNTGTTTLSDIAVLDAASNPNDGTLTPITVNCPSATLAPGLSEVCTGIYTVTQADVDSGQASDTPPTGNDPAGTPWVQDGATALAENSSGATVGPTALQTVYVYGTGATAAISLSKTSTSSFTASGQTLDYSYLVTNTGTISLTGVSVSDNVIPTVTCPLSPTANLAPGASETCTGSYTTTPTDVTNDGVTNEADASGFDVDLGNEADGDASLTIPYTGP
jgi:uncharacterized repeat protein (TIGR01451 family)